MSESMRERANRPFGGLMTIGVGALLVAFFSIGCTIKLQAPPDSGSGSMSADVHTANDRIVAKTFFVNQDGSPKTFLCGWAPETEVGYFGEHALGHNIPTETDCNAEFQITHNFLNVKEINPSFPTQPEKWPTIMSIPIKRHLVSKDMSPEAAKANAETPWQARPYMEINLSGLTVNSAEVRFLDPAQNSQITNVSDVTWQKKTAANFLGFTVTALDPAYGSDFQGRFRVNFLEFKHDPTFVRTPFREANERYLNVVNIVGEKAGGVYDVLSAIHWDLRTSHKIWITNFPDRYKQIAVDVLHDWDKTLQEIKAVHKGVQAFVPTFAPVKYAFDLRRPNINFVTSRRITEMGGGMIGISMTDSDVRDGQILWTGVNIFGGEMASYLKRYSSPSAVSSQYGSSSADLIDNNYANYIFNLDGFSSPQRDFNSLPFPTSSMNSPDQLAQALSAQNSSLLSPAVLAQTIRAREAQRIETDPKLTSAQRATQLAKLAEQPSLDSVASGHRFSPAQKIIGKFLAKESKEANDSYQFFRSEPFKNLLADEALKLPTYMAEQAQLRQSSSQSPRLAEQEAYARAVRHFRLSNVYDLDENASEVLPEMAQELDRDHNLNIQDTLRADYKGVMLHEFGHSLGLGHNFESNLLPKPGSVPPQVYQALAKRATAKEHYTNYTTVMGYFDPVSMVHISYNQWHPGPSDKQVLSYLYDQTYATYKPGDNHFHYVHLPISGEIPRFDPADAQYKTAYFPQCNDVDASFGNNPFCNRFNRGATADEIAQNYINRYQDNDVKELFALVPERGVSPDELEMYYWGKNLDIAGRLRLFYDYMRQHYRDQLHEIMHNQNALLHFSSDCQKSDLSQVKEDSPVLYQLFSQHPGLRDLCRVNAKVINEFASMASLKASDYTITDINQSVSPGFMESGDTTPSYGLFNGPWSQMSALPFKIPALYALTTPTPFVDLGGYLMSVPNYDTSGDRFAYSTLYPNEYTRAVAQAVTNNLQLKALDPNATSSQIGAAVLSMGYLNDLSLNGNNDVARINENFGQMIHDQTDFTLGLVAILITGQTKEGAPSYVNRFSGEVYDMQTGKSTALTDVYVLPNGNVIARAPNMFLLPISQLQVISDRDAYLIAIKAQYFTPFGDKLYQEGLKAELDSLNTALLDSCIRGSNGAPGLDQFFIPKSKGFDGFLMEQGISESREKQRYFLQSIKHEFQKYYATAGSTGVHPIPETCEEAQRGIGMLVSTAALLNQMWIPQMAEYILK